MTRNPAIAPEATAVRVALWRALHLQLDAPPPVVDDGLGLELVAPKDGWRERGDMHPVATRGARATVVARARFVEDLVAEQAANGVRQYVLLGAGLDTFAQRRPELAARLRVFEIDQPGPQAWKRARLVELGHGVPDGLRLVPVDFEVDDWWACLVAAGFEADRPAVVASLGVTMYLTHEANLITLRQAARLAPGSTLVITFQLPLEMLDPVDRPGRAATEKGARAAGTPFISFYPPDEIVALARAAGLMDVRLVPAGLLAERYFAGRGDGLRPSSGEDLLVAST